MAMGQAAEKREEYSRAVGLYRRLLQVKQSPLLPDAQFAVARCYELLGKGTAKTPGNAQYLERALQEYQVCAEKYPDSKFAPDAIVKIADFYYELKDYRRAIEIYDKTLRDYPDAKFVDLILLNYGKCLFKMKDYKGAADKFDKLVGEYPESEHVEKARKYAVYARQRGASGRGEAAGKDEKAEE
jgi:tetratricopeptide (TPR) repeat protein